MRSRLGAVRSWALALLPLLTLSCGGGGQQIPLDLLLPGDVQVTPDPLPADLVTADVPGDAGDGGPGPDLPPEICKTPGSLPEGPWFTEVTEEMGLGTADEPAVLAVTLRAADLDGDGFPDIIACAGSNT